MNEFIFELRNMDYYREMGGVSKSVINEAENILDLKFSNEYSEYLEMCGTATADGHEFTGLGRSQRLSVVAVTEKNRKINNNITKGLYVIEELGIDRIVIWQSVSGEIYQTVGDSKPDKIAESIAEYLK